jgi:hypothetical protein
VLVQRLRGVFRIATSSVTEAMALSSDEATKDTLPEVEISFGFILVALFSKTSNK